MAATVPPNRIGVDEFDDFETDPDDTTELDAYADELAEAVAAFDVPVLEPGRPA